MKKSDLKSGMVVVYRCGLKRLVVGNNLIGKDGSNSLSFYREDLTEKSDNSLNDIIKVIQPVGHSSFENMVNTKYFTTLWERKETVKVFRIWKFLQETMNIKDAHLKIAEAIKSGWLRECDGLTEDQFDRLCYIWSDDWAVEEEVK